MSDPYTGLKRAEENAAVLEGRNNPTLRDQFAMAALTGLLARELGDVSARAWRYADEMLKARREVTK